MEIRRFRLEDADKVAEHINRSDPGWPGSGFTHGVPFTGEWVREWFSDSDWEIFLAWEGEEVAGYSTLACIDRKKKTAYIPLLNVDPEFHGRGIGRQLLFKCVQRAIAGQYNRLDLHTWPANLKAIPLYKKMGFFWNPETSVHMVNYLPLILQNPLVREFIDSREWYGFLQRTLSLSEDEETWKGLEVFNYRWSWEEDHLQVRVDRKGEKIVNITSPSFAIGLALDRQKSPLNAVNNLYWEVKKDREETPVFISYQGEEDFWPRGNLPVRAREWTEQEEFKPAPGLELPPGGDKTAVLKAQVQWHNHHMEMGVGLELNPVLRITAPEELIELEPGEKKEVWFNLENCLDQDLVGELQLLGCSRLEITVPETDIELGPRGRGSIRVFLRGRGKGVADLDMVLLYRQGQEYFKAYPWQGKVLIRGDGELSLFRTGEQTWLVNDYLSLQLEGGRGTVWEKGRSEPVLKMRMMHWGPPFNSSLFYQGDFQHSIEGERAVISRSGCGDPRLGLKMEVALAGNHIYTDYELINFSDSREKVVLRPQNSAIFTAPVKVALPLRGSVIYDDYDPHTFPGYFDLSRPGEEMGALWQAFEEQGRVRGICLPPGEGQVEIMDDSFMEQKQVQEVEAFSRKCFPGPSFFVGPGTWEKVTDLAEKRGWTRVRGPLRTMGEPYWAGGLPVIKEGQGSGLLQADYAGFRESPLRIDLHFSRGLELASPTERVMAKEGQGYKRIIKWQGAEKAPGFYGIKTTYCLRGWQKEKYLPVVVASAQGETEIRTSGSVWELKNGELEFKLDPQFAGTLFSLQYQGQEILASPYPEPDVMEWIYPWYGGLGPNLFVKKRGRYPGPLSREKFSPRRVELTAPQGISWQGVALDIDPHYRDFKGLQITVYYLTLPGIPVLGVKLDLKNTTRATFRVDPRLIMFPAPDYIPPGSKLFAGRDNQVRTRKLQEMEGGVRQQDWLIFKGLETMALTPWGPGGMNFDEIPSPYKYMVSTSFSQLEKLGPRAEKSLGLMCFWGEREEPGSFCHSLARDLNIMEEN